MATLKFPTLAEQVAAEFRAATETISIATLAKRKGATVEKTWTATLYVFEDDTILSVTGRGKNHKITTHLP